MLYIAESDHLHFSKRNDLFVPPPPPPVISG